MKWKILHNGFGDTFVVDSDKLPTKGQIFGAVFGSSPKEISANANLILAAPEMLEALELVEKFLTTEMPGNSIYILADIRAVITKAKKKN